MQCIFQMNSHQSPEQRQAVHQRDCRQLLMKSRSPEKKRALLSLLTSHFPEQTQGVVRSNALHSEKEDDRARRGDMASRSHSMASLSHDIESGLHQAVATTHVLLPSLSLSHTCSEGDIGLFAQQSNSIDTEVPAIPYFFYPKGVLCASVNVSRCL